MNCTACVCGADVLNHELVRGVRVIGFSHIPTLIALCPNRFKPDGRRKEFEHASDTVPCPPPTFA